MYSSAVLIAVALISGYLYIMQTEAQRYKFKRAAGWHCYFHVAAWGIVFVGGAWLIFAIVNSLNLPPALQEPKIFLAQHSPIHAKNVSPDDEINFFIFCAAALLLPFVYCKLIRPIGCKIIDKMCSRHYSMNMKQLMDKRREKALLAAVKDNPFEEILTLACIRKQSVILSLSSRKFYVGRIAEMPAFSNGKIEYLKLVPFFSGYRDKDTLKTFNTTDYTAIFPDNDALMANEKIISSENIEDISFFDLDIYERFQQKNSTAATESAALNNAQNPQRI